MFSWPSLHERMCRTWGSNGAACMPSELASDQAAAPGQRYNMSHLMRKPVLPYANNKGADQHAHPRSLISAFVVRCLDSIITSIPEISSLCLTSVVTQAGLRQTPKTGFLVTKLICYCRTCFSMGDLGVQVSVHSSTFTLGVLWAQLLLYSVCRSVWNFAGVFVMVWGCACG